ncbi:CGNR zinc finger domain-containing protein [Actinomadura physcomitrii]
MQVVAVEEQPAGPRQGGQLDRVYVDTSRNGKRRFCSTACQNRVKTAAFRARAHTA